MFGIRKRRAAAAAEAAREAERRALFTQLVQRPAHICPFLGLAHERIGYVDGPSMEHRCFAFGEPAPLSSGQQTRVCQERGYGQCPRYLRGLLVTPPEELQALRTPLAAGSSPPLATADQPRRRRRGALLIALLILLLTGAVAAYFLLFRGGGVALDPSPSPRPTPTAVITAAPTVAASTTAEPTVAAPSATAAPSGIAPPTPEPTPAAGDTSAFYEVSVGPGGYLLFMLDSGGDVADQRSASFTDFSFARVEPVEGADCQVYWQTAEGGLEGLSYRLPDSGDFRIRAVFLDDRGSRRSVFLEDEDLSRFPEATPAP